MVTLPVASVRLQPARRLYPRGHRHRLERLARGLAGGRTAAHLEHLQDATTP